MYKVICIIILCDLLQWSIQNCPEEFTHNGISVKWSESETADNVNSEPLCYADDILVKRNCSNDKWVPAVSDVGSCSKVIMGFNTTSCPPGFNKMSPKNDEYCYQIEKENTWNYPCFSSGGASVITDLDRVETNSLINSLVSMNRSRYYWLPAHRAKIFNPVVWSIPGPNWGVHVVSSDYLKYQNFIWKNCLAFDVEMRVLTTATCTHKYPSLCFYINNVHFPAVCPKNYHSFRYKPDNGTCYGIETSNTNLTFESFKQTKCKKPMSDTSINRFIYTKLAEFSDIAEHQWCWFKTSYTNFLTKDHPYPQTFAELEGIINSAGTLGLINSSNVLPCMACETEVIYGETELMFEYNEMENQIYLTIYFPSGLWKYDTNDKGVQCFSDAKGFVKVVNINDLPFLSLRYQIDEETNYVEKVVYAIDLVTERSAQYWCEGHTFNFSFISTNKIVVNPKGKEIHVFAMIVNYYSITYEITDMSGIDDMISNLTEIFEAQKILVMDFLNLTTDFITVLLHVHTAVLNDDENEGLNIQHTFNDLKEKALFYLPSVNSSFVNLSSSVYCLPTTSDDPVILDWELTPIGHISAPKQFCLQSNGLPVTRQCLGSYHNGAVWGNVEGHCDTNYSPTETTTFLYNVGKGQVSSNYTSRFLTDGLGFVLSDVEIIIPADIYYLSMSLQQVIQTALENDTCVDIGDIDNIAWVMDRVMEFDWDYLRLAQTLNSTNVILNSVNEIIEMIAQQAFNNTIINSTVIESNIPSIVDEAYQIAVQSQFIVQISYPILTNVTGLAISKMFDTDNFTDMVIKPLYSNTTLDEVLSIKNLEIATWLPLKLLNTLQSNTNETLNEACQRNKVHIIISVFQNDAVFQELVPNQHKINSRIVGVTIPGFVSNLEHPLPIIFRQLNPAEDKKLCGFWNFELQKSTLLSGFWKTQGCFLVQSGKNITICECYHLTHFSQLITIPSNSDIMDHPNVKQHTKALNIITLVGCFLSLVGIIGIWLTALVFANWRKKAGTKILLQLSTAIALPLIFIVIFNLDNSIFVFENENYIIARKPLCIVLGSLLHYSILSSFMWMLITAILQFIRYVRVLGVSRPSRFMFKFSLVGWGIPLVPVIIVLALDVDNYVPDSSYSKKLCYPKGYYFILSVMLPICIILVVNVILFVHVIHSISRGSSNEKMKSTDIDLVGAQLRLSIFLFFLLGLTWIFGIFSFTTNLLWSYLFCLTSTLQGFVLFIYFIICDPTTRNMWISLVKPPFTSGSSRNSISSYN